MWHQVALLRRAAVAHRRLTGHTLRLDDNGQVWVVGTGGGEVAADQVALNLDVTQALVELAMLVGAERTVPIALDVVGPQAVAEATPLLQPVLLNRETRVALRRHKNLLATLRNEVGATIEVPTVAPRVEKLRPRTIITGLAAVVALYIVASQFVGVNVGKLIREASPLWLVAAIGAQAITYVGAGLSVVGFVTEKLSLLRTIAVQVGLGFIRLVAPPAVTSVAINARYLIKSGISPAGAAASMAASQLVALITGIILLPLLGTLTGRNIVSRGPGAPVVVGVLAVLAVAIAVVAVLPRLRTPVMAAVRRFTETALPRLAELAQQPLKLAQGLGGTLLITAGYVACLDFCALAFGAHVPVTLVAVVYLTGNTIGSLLPTPAGVGAVEAVLTAGMTAVGVPAVTAVPLVLVFRMISFLLPMAPGWVAWTYLTRRGYV